MHKKGFTLIELLVIIAIVSLLSAVVISSLNTARQKAKQTQVKMEIDQIRKAMLMYKIDVGELPPVGDLCSSCSNPPNVSWTLVIDALVAGKYLAGRIDKDPWGNYYGYDDNDCNSNAGVTNLFSSGPDRISATSDDYLVLVTLGCNS